MYNEDIRKKAVYETNDFDPEDQKLIKNRETEAIQLIKDGKMPVELIKGEVTVNIFNS